MSTDEDNIRDLYRGADKPTPGKALDDTILAAARDAVAQQAAGSAPFSGRWPAAAAVAAVIVIAVILVPVLKQQNQPSSPPPAEQAAQPVGQSAESAYRAKEPQRKSIEPARPATAPGLIPVREPSADDRAQPRPEAIAVDTGDLPSAIEYRNDREEPVSRGSTAGASSSMHAADSAPFAVYTPEMWEAKISRLITENRLDQARAELDELRQHYPDHRIDPSLAKQLDAP